MAEIKAGDEVVVFEGSLRSDKSYPGVVEKVGRTLVHIKARGAVGAYRLDTGKSNDRQYGRGWFLTLAEAEERLRLIEGVEYLRSLGIEFNAGRRAGTFTADQVEALVALVRSFGGQR